MTDKVELIINISKHQYEICKQALKDFGDRPITECEFAIAVGTPVNGKTNGEVIQALFPNVSVYEHGSTYSVNNEYNFNSTWWNAPYKAERSDKE